MRQEQLRITVVIPRAHVIAQAVDVVENGIAGFHAFALATFREMIQRMPLLERLHFNPPLLH